MNLQRAQALQGSYIIFSDVQGSAEALKRFFNATKGMGNPYICLGDIIDRGVTYAENQCVDLVKEYTTLAVRGNHETFATRSRTEGNKLTFPNIHYLSQLPETILADNALLFHSSIKARDARLFTSMQLEEERKHIAKQYPDVRVGFFGHTHEKKVYGIREIPVASTLNLNPETLHLINPGGIGVNYGVERSFAIFDFDNWRLHHLTLEDAEKEARKAEIFNAFEQRWMPVLNTSNYQWFTQYAQHDAPELHRLSREIPAVRHLAVALQQFNPQISNLAPERKSEYLRQYSKRLADAADRLRSDIHPTYSLTSALETRNELLRLSQNRS